MAAAEPAPMASPVVDDKKHQAIVMTEAESAALAALADLPLVTNGTEQPIEAAASVAPNDETPKVEDQPLIKPIAKKPGPLRIAFESPNKERKLAAAHAVYVANDKKGPKSIYTKYKGVCFYARVGCWNAHIWYGQRDVYLGSYENEHHAARVYDIAALKCRGLAAQLNYPLDDYEKVLDLLDAMDTDTMMLLVRTCGYPADRVGRHVRNKQPTQQEPSMSSEEFLENVTAGLQRYLDEGQATAAAAVIAARSGKTLPFLQSQQDKSQGAQQGSSEGGVDNVEDDTPSDPAKQQQQQQTTTARLPGAASYGSDHNMAGPATDSGGRARRSVRSRQHSAMWKDFVVGEDAMPRANSRDGMSSDGETSSRQPRGGASNKRPDKKRAATLGSNGAQRNAKLARIGNVATVATGPLKAAWGPLGVHGLPTQPRGSNYYPGHAPHGYPAHPALLNPPPLPRRRGGARYVGQSHEEDEYVDEYGEEMDYGRGGYDMPYGMAAAAAVAAAVDPHHNQPPSLEASPMARRQATVEALIELQQQPPRQPPPREVVVDTNAAAAAAAEAAAREAELMFLREQTRAQSRQLETLNRRVQELEAQLAQAMVQQSMMMEETRVAEVNASSMGMGGGQQMQSQKKKPMVGGQGGAVGGNGAGPGGNGKGNAAAQSVNVVAVATS